MPEYSSRVVYVEIYYVKISVAGFMCDWIGVILADNASSGL